MRANKKKLIIILASVFLLFITAITIPVVKYRLWAIVPAALSHHAYERERDAEIQQQFTYLEEEFKEFDDLIEKVVFQYARPESLIIHVTYRERRTENTSVKEIQEIVDREKENIRQYYLERPTEQPNDSKSIAGVSLCIDLDADEISEHIFTYSYNSEKWNTTAP